MSTGTFMNNSSEHYRVLKIDRDKIIRDKGDASIMRGGIPAGLWVHSTVVPFKGGFAGVFRCDNRAHNMTIRRGHRCDG